jgi:hypothetical protein
MSAPVSPLATIQAGQAIEARLLDGAVLAIWVRQMPARHLLTKYLALSDDEAELLDGVCTHIVGQPELPAGWVDQLTDDSHAKLVETAHELNFSRAAKQVERGMQFRRRLQPLEDQTKSLPSSST